MTRSINRHYDISGSVMAYSKGAMKHVKALKDALDEGRLSEKMHLGERRYPVTGTPKQIQDNAEMSRSPIIYGPVGLYTEAPEDEHNGADLVNQLEAHIVPRLIDLVILGHNASGREKISCHRNPKANPG
jgi:hypothetical protein